MQINSSLNHAGLHPFEFTAASFIASWLLDMTPSDLKAAREKYQYIPARLIRAPNNCEVHLNWKSLKLIMDVPKAWDTGQQVRSRYSSWELDEFHHGLLQSEDETDLLHGLLSVVFWGFASGADGRLHLPRALSRAEVIVSGRNNALRQADTAIIAHLKRSRKSLNGSRIAEALLEAEQIKFVKMSFASKLLTSMQPNMAAVYDSVVSFKTSE